MHDYNGQALAVGQGVTIAGRIVELSEDSATIEVSPMPGTDGELETIEISPALVCLEGTVRSERVFYEYPKDLGGGRIAQSKEHEAQLLDEPVAESAPASSGDGSTVGMSKPAPRRPRSTKAGKK